MASLLTENNAKIRKSNASGKGYLTAIMHLAPARASGKNVCAYASPGCIAACLNTAGRGIFETIQEARIRKTQFFTSDREGFMTQLVRDIAAHERKAERLSMWAAIRLNGTSDLPWENIGCTRDDYGYSNLMRAFPKVQFYDYTKAPLGARDWLPGNYTLTFSRSELTTDADVLDNIHAGRNVAVVFAITKGAKLPMFWLGVPVVDGDESDQRFLDHSNVIIGLRAKGKAGKADASGFVVEGVES